MQQICIHQQGRLNIFQRNNIRRLDPTNDVVILRQFYKLARHIKNIRNKTVCPLGHILLNLLSNSRNSAEDRVSASSTNSFTTKRYSTFSFFVSMFIQNRPMTTILDIRVNTSSMVSCRPLMNTSFSNAYLLSSG